MESQVLFGVMKLMGLLELLVEMLCQEPREPTEDEEVMVERQDNLCFVSKWFTIGDEVRNY